MTCSYLHSRYKTSWLGEPGTVHFIGIVISLTLELSEDISLIQSRPVLGGRSQSLLMEKHGTLFGKTLFENITN